MGYNKAEVQQFLTSLRAKVTPEQAGLTFYNGERRVPGLRREEVAQLTGVSTTYYTRIERGDLSGVSESVLHSLTRALNMNDAETMHLFDLARASSGPRIRQMVSQAKFSPRISQLLESMDDVPAIALNKLSDVVASNRLGRALFPDLFKSNEPPLNHARYLFLDDRAKTFYPDWQTSAQDAVSALRLLVGQNPADTQLLGLIAELANGSSDFRTWWGGHSVRIHSNGTKRINHPVVGEMTLGYEVLSFTSSPGIRLVTYLAEPGSPSDDSLSVLKSWAASANVQPIVNR